MPRIRFIKPEFFTDPDVIDLSFGARLLFIGLWTYADREGRLEYDPRRLKHCLFPGDDVSIPVLAAELRGKDMVRTYLSRAGRDMLWITKFTSHQRPHRKEAQSVNDPCPNTAGKFRGEPGNSGASPGKDIASPPDSGFLSTDSKNTGVQAREQAVPAGQPINGTPSSTPRAPIHDKAHRNHALCGRICLHAEQLGRFVRRRNTATADKDIREWAFAIIKDWTEGAHATVEPGDEFAFWRARYDEQWPAAEIAPKPAFSKTAGNAEALQRFAARGGI